MSDHEGQTIISAIRGHNEEIGKKGIIGMKRFSVQQNLLGNNLSKRLDY